MRGHAQYLLLRLSTSFVILHHFSNLCDHLPNEFVPQIQNARHAKQHVPAGAYIYWSACREWWLFGWISIFRWLRNTQSRCKVRPNLYWTSKRRIGTTSKFTFKTCNFQKLFVLGVFQKIMHLLKWKSLIRCQWLTQNSLNFLEKKL